MCLPIDPREAQAIASRPPYAYQTNEVRSALLNDPVQPRNCRPLGTLGLRYHGRQWGTEMMCLDPPRLVLNKLSNPGRLYLLLFAFFLEQ